jgi:tRNA U34 5-methylaminomethyl-2-thiouridine-forming methyltransferase MnmC
MREIVVTRDGSHTVAIPEKRVMYHSVHGAMQESVHVFIEAGLRYVAGRAEQPDSIRIFEMGFGTGLNAFLTAIEAAEKNISIHYTTVEAFPLTTDEAAVLNYAETLGHAALFRQLHACSWNEEARLSDFFTITKHQTELMDFSTSQRFNLIYYDAFAPSAQPELWTKEVFEKLYNLLEPGSVLVTYCSKGDVRRAMLKAGFAATRLAGPPGKREMLRGIKA